MTNEQMDTKTLLGQYLSLEVKYDPAPVPARVDRAQAIGFVQDQLARMRGKDEFGEEDLEDFRQLVLLAVFHNLRQCAGDFGKFLDRNEMDVKTYSRSALALLAIAWLGAQKEVDDAWAYFEQLLKRANAQRDKERMLEACDAFGPGHDTTKLKAWVQAEVDRVQKKTAKHKADGATEQAFYSENLAIQLIEFIKFDVKEVDQANEHRAKLIASKPAAQTRRLVSFYLGEGRDSVQPMTYWSTIVLMRNGSGDAKVSSEIADEFTKRAEVYDKKDAKNQLQLDAMRARCLRAADFFAHRLTPEQSEFLDAQHDEGTDALALRPKWKYIHSYEQAVEEEPEGGN